MKKVRNWIDSVLPEYDKTIVSELMANYHITDISELYCVNSVNKIISDFEADKARAEKVKLFFSLLWSSSRLMTLSDFLGGFGVNKKVVIKLMGSGCDTLEKIRQVNYGQLLKMGVEQGDAEAFIDDMVYLSDEMDAVLNTNMVRINGEMNGKSR